jgi:hypothetical protein
MNENEYTIYKDPYLGYTIGLAFTGQIGEYGKAQVAYYLDDPEGQRIFEGSDFYPAPSMSCDGPEAAASLLTFLTLQPGDTDPDYFNDYTADQLAWCESMDSEELGSWAMDVEEGADWAPEEV